MWWTKVYTVTFIQGKNFFVVWCSTKLFIADALSNELHEKEMTSRPANIGPQDVLRTSSSNGSMASHKDPIWQSRGYPNQTFRGCPNLTPKEPPWVVDSGHPQNVLRTSLEDLLRTSYGRCGVISWMSLDFFTFLSELIRFTKSI